MNYLAFTHQNTLQYFRKGKTSNKKVANINSRIIQTYTFSKEQFEYIANCLNDNKKPTLKEFFSLDKSNCFDCPFSMGSGDGGCYTHKFMQYSGFLCSLKMLVREFKTFDAIPTYEANRERITNDLAEMSTNLYVRFGTYGEPSMHPIELVRAMVNKSKSWTGYTHQYFRKPEYKEFLMASVHNELQAKTANQKFGYRSFIASKINIDNKVQCPASKEAGFKSNCESCGLCSGVTGKGKKDIVILEH